MCLELDIWVAAVMEAHTFQASSGTERPKPLICAAVAHRPANVPGEYKPVGIVP